MKRSRIEIRTCDAEDRIVHRKATNLIIAANWQRRVLVHRAGTGSERSERLVAVDGDVAGRQQIEEAEGGARRE